MTDQQMKVPGPDHPIIIESCPSHIVVKAGGQTIADTTRAVSLKEASYPAVHYIPREDAKMDRLAKSEYQTYCPYKGSCSYYSIRGGDETSENAVWTYEDPYAAVAAIKGYLAFYPNRVDSIEVLPADR